MQTETSQHRNSLLAEPSASNTPSEIINTRSNRLVTHHATVLMHELTPYSAQKHPHIQVTRQLYSKPLTPQIRQESDSYNRHAAVLIYNYRVPHILSCSLRYGMCIQRGGDPPVCIKKLGSIQNCVQVHATARGCVN